MKSCGACNLCCKVLAIAPLEKPAGQWCAHAVMGKGCAIHGQHPEVCQVFQCGWLTYEALGEEWRPSKCGFVLRPLHGGRRISVNVDPAKPDAWRRAPYLAQLKAWSQGMWAGTQHVVIQVGDRTIAMFPEEELVIEGCDADDMLAVTYAQVGGFRRPMARVTRKDGTVVEVSGGLHGGPMRR